MTRAKTSLAVIALALCAHAARAEITLENAWLRPAYAGQPSASVYVDIRSTQALTLVGASSPAAKSAELVLVDSPDNDAAKHKVVKAMPVAANAKTRLAYLGSHVRLVEVRRDILPGESIALELAFIDAKGKRYAASTEARVRGLMARRPVTGGEEVRK